MRPQTLDELIGQEKTKRVLKILVDSAKRRRESLSHILLHGSAGKGKTSIAKCIANELDSQLFVTNGATVKNIKDLFPIIRALKAGDILFIDEIHSVSRKVMEWFYTVMEDFEFYGRDGKKYNVPLKDNGGGKFTVIGATTRLGSVEKPLRDRFKYVCEIEEYSIEELSEIIKKVCLKNNLQVSDEVAVIIAKTCRGTPRLAVNRTEFIRDYLISNNKTYLDESVIDIIKMQGIDEEGFTDLDHRYMDELVGGPKSLASLASRLNTDPETLLEEVEPYLFQKGKVEITRSGRQLIESFDYDNLGL